MSTGVNAIEILNAQTSNKHKTDQGKKYIGSREFIVFIDTYK
jgi:hypothetical protein